MSGDKTADSNVSMENEMKWFLDLTTCGKLLRQAEVAAQSLHELGQKLKQLAEQYRV